MQQDATAPEQSSDTSPATGPETTGPGAAPADRVLEEASSEQSETVTGTVAETGAQDSGAPESIEPENGSALEELVGFDRIREQGLEWGQWLLDKVLTIDIAIQGAVIIAALAPAAMFGPRLKKLIDTQVAPRAPHGVLRRAANAFAHIATPIALYLTLQVAGVVLGAAGVNTALLSAGVSLLTAWIVIRLVTMVIRSPLWSRVAFYVVWPLAALDAFGVLDNVVTQLDAFAIPLSTNDAGQTIDISALDIVRGVITFAILFWLAGMAGNFLKGRIQATDELTVSFKALLSKILDILLPVVALLIALQLVNFPFGALAIFGGAIGLGVGLGLQRTVSNFAAGFTLIADKSIKPGDVVEVGDTFGWVTEMNARYVAVRTRDGTAHLVPNDKFIEDGVINWSHSDRVVRLHAGIGVSYDTKDLRMVKQLCEDVAKAQTRVLERPAPMCNLIEFGDSSVNFDLRFWINDPANGTANVRSEVMLAVWEALMEKGIEIPFPQRDLHIKSVAAPLEGVLEALPHAEQETAPLGDTPRVDASKAAE